MNEFFLPLVSVIIPCYNAERYVERAIRSIMEQTYKNLEIIIIDDCSTDSTGKIIKELAQQDSRIVYISNTENLKVVKTVNKAIELCNGEYIARMDADDISLKDRIAKQLNFLLSNNDIDLIGGNSVCIDANDNILRFRTFYPNQHNKIIKQIPYKVTFSNPTVMGKKSFFIDLLGYRNVEIAEDYDLWIRGMLEGKRFANLSDILIYYRIHQNQATANMGYSPRNEKVIRKFLYEYFLKTKDFRFLLGMAVHTKIFNNFIRKTYKFRKFIMEKN